MKKISIFKMAVILIVFILAVTAHGQENDANQEKLADSFYQNYLRYVLIEEFSKAYFNLEKSIEVYRQIGDEKKMSEMEKLRKGLHPLLANEYYEKARGEYELRRYKEAQEYILKAKEFGALAGSMMPSGLSALEKKIQAKTKK